MEIGLNELRGPYDLIVIGSGPAGLTLARKYDDLTGNKTLVIESGPRIDKDSAAQKLSLVDAEGDLPADYYSLHSRRVFGGSSTIWSGYCAVLEKRAFLNGEWPFDYDDLYRYYPPAADILSVTEAVHARPETPFPDNANIVYRPYYFSSPTRFNAAYGDWLMASESVDVLFNRTVTKINVPRRDNAASSVSVRESSEHVSAPATIFGKRIALAAGGLQNARLLQLSLSDDSRFRLPVGAYFDDHPHIRKHTEIILDAQKFLEITDMDTPRIAHAIALSSDFSQKHGLMSATFEIHHDPELMGADIYAHSINAYNILGRNRNAIAETLTIRAEMPSLRTNGITLSDTRKDFLGQPAVRISLRWDFQEIEAVMKQINTELIRSGLGRLAFKEIPRGWGGGGHFMGSTRMGNDPDTSVTDAYGRVHGLENLYVAGSSLFPAAGSANPTLTIVALALRLADYLANGDR